MAVFAPSVGQRFIAWIGIDVLKAFVQLAINPWIRMIPASPAVAILVVIVIGEDISSIKRFIDIKFFR